MLGRWSTAFRGSAAMYRGRRGCQEGQDPPGSPWPASGGYLHRLSLGKPGENSLVQGGCLGLPGEPLPGTGHTEGHPRDLAAELNTDDTANRAPW